MKSRNSSILRKWLRIIHRDLGYFAVGIILVYSISGIILNHKKIGIDPAYKTTVLSSTYPIGLSPEEFKIYFRTTNGDLELTKLMQSDSNYRLFLNGGTGNYNVKNGELNYQLYEKKHLVSYLNKLHLNQKKHWLGVADFTAISLLFLAISGLFLIKGKNGFRRRGVWFMIAGFILVLIYIWI